MTYVRLEDGRPGADPSTQIVATIADVLGTDPTQVEAAAIRRARTDHAALASPGT
jgi:hypothetical protein